MLPAHSTAVRTLKKRVCTVRPLRVLKSGCTGDSISSSPFPPFTETGIRLRAALHTISTTYCRVVCGGAGLLLYCFAVLEVSLKIQHATRIS